MKTIQLFCFVLLGLMCFATVQASVEITSFTVTKNFTDDDNGGPFNPTEVEVTINCFTGLPLTQTQSIDQNQELEFVVEDFADGTLDCDISENLDAPELAGYTPTYTAGGDSSGTSDDDGCHFDDVTLGAANTCAIQNDADPVPVEIEKDWIIEGMGGDQVNQYFELTLYCDSHIVGSDPRGPAQIGCSNGLGKSQYSYDSCLELPGNGDTIFTPHVIPEWPSTHCWVDEDVYDDSVEVDNNCGDINVSHGEGDSCLITNTVFFEGIPTLSQYGMAIMALLMLGLGLVGFRRFV
jgi:hypothetical protein